LPEYRCTPDAKALLFAAEHINIDPRRAVANTTNWPHGLENQGYVTVK
jgi:hypothetical protein